MRAGRGVINQTEAINCDKARRTSLCWTKRNLPPGAWTEKDILTFIGHLVYAKLLLCEMEQTYWDQRICLFSFSGYRFATGMVSASRHTDGHPGDRSNESSMDRVKLLVSEAWLRPSTLERVATTLLFLPLSYHSDNGLARDPLCVQLVIERKKSFDLLEGYRIYLTW